MYTGGASAGVHTALRRDDLAPTKVIIYTQLSHKYIVVININKLSQQFHARAARQANYYITDEKVE